MLLAGKVGTLDATFEVDSGANISLIAPDLLLDSDVVPGTTVVSGVFKQSKSLQCAVVDCVIESVYRKFKFCYFT